MPVATAAPSPDAVIAEVYGGGGNSGATLTQDFIELGTRGAAAVSVTGWSVQYLPANPSATSQWQVTPLSGEVSPDRRYLVAEATGSGGTVPLPTPDVTGTIAMAATAGTVALVTSTERLTCKTAADCAADTRIRDLVGYGNAVVRELTPAPTLSNTSSAQRSAALLDTDDNGADFTSGEPTPAGGGGGTPPVTARIHEIQGGTRLSPLDGQQVSGVPGIVTAVRAFGSARGFWFQDPQPDADPATSEGLFAFTGSATPAVAAGDSVLVSGTVDEFYPDAPPSSSVHQSTTELTNPQWTIVSSGNPLPPAEILGADTVPVAYTPEAGGASIEPLALRPADFALDFFESRESMRVQVDDARVVGPTTEFNELFVTTKPNQNPTPRGGTLYSGYDQQNSGRLLIQSLIPFAQRPFPKAHVGDRLAGVTAGPVDYSRFGGYQIQATELGELVPGGLQRETTRPQRPYELAVATYNVENLAPDNDPAKFARLAEGLVRALASPDIVALEEIQDNNGAVDDAVVAADETLRLLTEAIVAAGGPRYQWRQIDPVDDADGGQPGGNIRVAFLFNPARVSFVDHPGGDATTPVDVTGHWPFGPRLTVSPGRVNPTSDAWLNSRKPLAGEFRFLGQTFFVIANHFNSKGGDQPLTGRFQPPARSSEVQRVAQATEVSTFVRKIQSLDRHANIVVLGDINDFPFSPAAQQLTAGGSLVDLINTLPPAERYNYVFQGNSQTLDHVFVGGLRLVDYDVVHVNAEFFDQVSDHDPQVVRIFPFL
ncbi:MAG TPA: endonuclease/exonuclease/phosphatase family protein [Actinophytocola sp.]|nr:endonuclease/exonuclease/phosphatase family protein [Actinophytocola sp.]HEV2779997.1 endonuclease/exonuclease/phosphatase family protein [Actinophytocola sp.]